MARKYVSVANLLNARFNLHFDSSGSNRSFLLPRRRYEGRLKQVRRNLEDLAHDLLAAKRNAELGVHCFALGYGTSTDECENIDQKEGSKAEAAAAAAEPGANEKVEILAEDSGERRLPSSGDATPLTPSSAAVEHPATKAEVDHLSIDGHFDDADIKEKTATVEERRKSELRTRDTPASSITRETSAMATEQSPEQGSGVEQDRTQAAGEAATESAGWGSGGNERSSLGGATKPADDGTHDQKRELKSAEVQGITSSPPPDLNHATESDNGGGAVHVEEETGQEPLLARSKVLPDSLAQEIADRAFPLANAAEQEEDQGGRSRGVSCAAFHALAAEAVWAGFTGSDPVEKPPESVWDPRGGDRWGTASFFAEQIGEREEEAAPGLPQHAKTSNLQVVNGKGDGCANHVGDGGGRSGGRSGEHPLSGSSGRHAAARTLCMAAVSSRRGFLKQATEAAVKEVSVWSRLFFGELVFLRNEPSLPFLSEKFSCRREQEPLQSVVKSWHLGVRLVHIVPRAPFVAWPGSHKATPTSVQITEVEETPCVQHLITPHPASLNHSRRISDRTTLFRIGRPQTLQHLKKEETLPSARTQSIPPRRTARISEIITPGNMEARSGSPLEVAALTSMAMSPMTTKTSSHTARGPGKDASCIREYLVVVAASVRTSMEGMEKTQ